MFLFHQHELMFHGIFQGMLFLMMIFLLVLYRSIRKKYLWHFSGYILFIGLCLVANECMNKVSLGSSIVNYLIVMGIVSFLHVFTMSYLQTKQHNVKVHIFLLITLTFTLVGFFAMFYLHVFLKNISFIGLDKVVGQILFLINIIAISLACYSCWRHKKRHISYYLTAFLPGIFLVVLNASSIEYKIPHSQDIAILIQVMILSLCFVKEIKYMLQETDKMWQTVQDATNQLINWHEVLEVNVNERTSVIKNVLDQTDQGFLSLDTQMKVLDEYSAICKKLFGRDISGEYFYNLIAEDEESKNLIIDVYKQLVLPQNRNKFDLYVGLLPEEVQLNNFNIKITYKQLQAESNHDGVVMVVLTDTTQMLALEKEIEVQNMYLEKIIKIVTHIDDFNECINSYKVFYKHTLVDLLNSSLPVDSIRIEILKSIHTLKGNFSIFEMSNLVDKLHKLEDRMLNETWDKEQLKRKIDPKEIRQWLMDEIGELKHSLNPKWLDHSDTITLDLDRIRRVEMNMQKCLPKEICEKLLPDVIRLRYVAFSDLLSVYQSYAESLGKKNGKRLKALIVEPLSVRVDSEKYISFVRSLGHIFTNAVEHGIESPDERITLGKPSYGTILCTVGLSKQGILLSICDDGRGMDIDCEDKSLSEIGLGFESIYLELKKLGGSYSIKSDPGEGTAFIFNLPYYEVCVE